MSVLLQRFFFAHQNPPAGLTSSLTPNAGALALACLIGVACAATSGCGKPQRDRPETAEVGGVVTLGGKALANATVVFHSDTYEGVAQTDAQGRFQLIAGTGANKVYFCKVEGKNKARFDPLDLRQMTPEQLKKNALKQLVPADGASLQATKHSFDVSSDTDDANFQL